MKRERGMAVAMVMAILTVVMLIGALSLGLITANLRTAGVHRGAARAQYCAEAGLAAGRTFFMANLASWDTYLACNASPATCPAGYPLTGAAAQDGSAAYQVTIEDNYDELPPSANNPLADNDLTVIVVSRCTDPLLPTRVLQQYVTYDYSQAGDYRAQAGFGRDHAGNQN